MTASGSLIACRTEYAITTCRSSCHAAGLIISSRRSVDLKGTRRSERQRLDRHQHERRLENNFPTRCEMKTALSFSSAILLPRCHQLAPRFRDKNERRRGRQGSTIARLSNNQYVFVTGL